MPALGEKYRRAVVTGASRGLGRAFASILLDEGVEVWGTARNVSGLEEHPKMHWEPLDLTHGGDLEAFISKMRDDIQPDLLINNAGSAVFAAWETFPEDEISKQIELMLTAPIRLSRALYPAMRERKSGAIVNVASLAADFPLPYMPLYNASKAGLSRFTRTLEMDASDTPLCILDFQPGDYKTSFNAVARKEFGAQRVESAWACLEAHLQAGPDPVRAAQDLRRALLRGKSGLFTSGSFFQAKLAPLLARLASWSVVKFFLRRYYKLP